MRTLHITSYEELRRVDHKAVITWERIMREADGDAPSTERRRLSSFSSLFEHLVRYDHAEKNPVTEVERPAINRRHGTTLVFSKQAAAKLLSAPAEETIEGLRDRAILSVGLQAGLRRAEIAALAVDDLHQNRGYDSLWVTRKGGQRDSLAIHPNTAQHIRAYFNAAGHADDSTGLCFAHSVTIVRDKNRAGTWTLMILRKHVKAIGIVRGYSAHSMRATCVTTALENGCPLEDVQQAAGHAEPGTTKLYDRRGYNPEKSASFFATY
jgi:integrase/recombinase XerD